MLTELDFSEAEIQRYSRHILLAEVGAAGQARLRAARVLVVGAGGLGSPLILYLAAAGVGTIGIVDDDIVALSNLQRQIAHGTAGIGQLKTESAARAARAIDPGLRVEAHALRLSGDNADALAAAYDVICDGSDNAETRYVLSDACQRVGRPLVSGAALRFEGQVTVFMPGGPCYRCLYPEKPPAGLVPSCAEAGVLGAVTGVIGTLQATEVLKLILGIGRTLMGRLLLWDGMAGEFRTVRYNRHVECHTCGTGRVAAP